MIESKVKVKRISIMIQVVNIGTIDIMQISIGYQTYKNNPI